MTAGRAGKSDTHGASPSSFVRHSRRVPGWCWEEWQPGGAALLGQPRGRCSWPRLALTSCLWAWNVPLCPSSFTSTVQLCQLELVFCNGTALCLAQRSPVDLSLTTAPLNLPQGCAVFHPGDAELQSCLTAHHRPQAA